MLLCFSQLDDNRAEAEGRRYYYHGGYKYGHKYPYHGGYKYGHKYPYHGGYKYGHKYPYHGEAQTGDMKPNATHRLVIGATNYERLITL